jgi:hypothetical protein
VGGARNVQVAIDGDLSPETGVPIGSPRGAAPLRELGNRSLSVGWRTSGQWLDQHSLHVGAEGEQPPFGFLQPSVTP